jgi:ribosomal protein S27E
MKNYDFEVKCAKCGFQETVIGSDTLYHFCPICGEKIEPKITDEWEAENENQ